MKRKILTTLAFLAIAYLFVGFVPVVAPIMVYAIALCAGLAV